MENTKKLISIVTPCYNEEENVREVYERVKEVFLSTKQYDYEHIFIDNASTDKTVSILKELAKQDSNLKIIVNRRNYGHIRSPYYGLLQANGDAVILFVADLQDPPEMILKFLSEWESGYKIIVGVKNQSEESPVFFWIRKIYYHLVTRLSEIKLIKNFTGFGLYDRIIIDDLKKIQDPYPYFRGLICEIGFDILEIPYTQPVRKRGFTKNNFYTLYDIGMLGITGHSKIPLRIAAFAGFILSAFSLFMAFVYLVAKLLFWNYFIMGIPPILLSVFLFSSVQLFFIGILGEYIGAIHTQVLNRPIVSEKERINF